MLLNQLFNAPEYPKSERSGRHPKLLMSCLLAYPPPYALTV